MSVKVSVITPIYNRESLVPNMVMQLKCQTLQNIEFLLVDDASTDNTLPLLRRLVENDSRFKIITMVQNSGPSACRNKALAEAKGRYIGFFDSDDKIPEDYFDKLLSTAESSNTDIVYTAYNGWRHKEGDITGLKDKIKALRNGAIWDKLYRTALLKEHGITFAEGLYTADNLFNIKAFYFARHIQRINAPVYRYALQQDSIGRAAAKMEKRKNDILEIIKQILAFAAENNFKPRERLELQNFLWRTYPDYSKDKIFQKQLKELLDAPRPKGRIATHKPYNQGADMTTGLLKTMRLLHLIDKEKYNQKRYVELVKASPLFDTRWYLAQNPDVKAKKISAARHYVKFGWKEGRNPGPNFDGNAYLAENDDVAAAGICPLVHYLISGYKEGRYYQTVSGAQGETAPSPHRFATLKEKIKYALEYPIRLQEECDRLKAEINTLKNLK